MENTKGQVARSLARVLTLRSQPNELDGFGFLHLLAAWMVAWLVGALRAVDKGETSMFGIEGVGFALFFGLLSFPVFQLLAKKKPSIVAWLTVTAVQAGAWLPLALPTHRIHPIGAHQAIIQPLGILSLVWWFAVLFSVQRRALGMSGDRTAIGTSLLPGLAMISFTWACKLEDMALGRGSLELSGPEAYGMYSGICVTFYCLIAVATARTVPAFWLRVGNR